MKKLYINDLIPDASQIVLGLMRLSEAKKDPVEIIKTAYDNGINYFDHADIYGNGKSETIFGEAFKKTRIKREDVYIQSKAGIRPNVAYDFSKKHLLEAVDGILKRLQVDYLDALLLHRPDTLVEPEEVAEVFNILEKAGKVRTFGVSNQNPLQIELLKTAIKQPLLYNQLQFSVMHTGMIDAGIHVNMTDERSIVHDDGILEYSRIHKMTIQAWSPFQYGFFAGVFVDNDKFLELNKKLRELADKYNVTPTGIAISWISTHPANMQTVIGTMTPNRIKAVCDASDIRLTKEEWYEIYLAAGNDLP